LQIEQAQLATVRALEAELARLRAYYSNNQAGTGVTGPSVGVRSATPSLFPAPSNMTVPGAGFAQPQVFQPGPGQAPMTQGHEGLPPGLVLPEGWTLTPLNRVEGTSQLGGVASQPPVPTPTIAVPATEAPAPREQTEESTTSNTTEIPAVDQSTEQSHNAQEEEAPEVESSSHNEELSSLLPPQAPSSSTQSEQPEPLSVNDQLDLDEQRPAEYPVETSSGTPAQPSSSLPITRSTGLGESSNWNFDNVDNVEAESSTQQTDPEEQPKAVDKGKGRAVTVEDVDDAEQ
ncbi:hypothetical protein KCU94_g20910, partial [Aureobasidium melanogenum]